MKELYGDAIDDTIAIIKNLGGKVLHGIDATNLDLHFNEFAEAMGNEAGDAEWGLFHNVYWNFPHAGCVRGFPDGHQMVSWRHINLMRLFFRSVRNVLGSKGIVKISTNANATGVNLPDVIQSAESAHLVLTQQVQFDDWEYCFKISTTIGKKKIADLLESVSLRPELR